MSQDSGLKTSERARIFRELNIETNRNKNKTFLLCTRFALNVGGDDVTWDMTYTSLLPITLTVQMVQSTQLIATINFGKITCQPRIKKITILYGWLVIM